MKELTKQLGEIEMMDPTLVLGNHLITDRSPSRAIVTTSRLPTSRTHREELGEKSARNAKTSDADQPRRKLSLTHLQAKYGLQSKGSESTSSLLKKDLAINGDDMTSENNLNHLQSQIGGHGMTSASTTTSKVVSNTHRTRQGSITARLSSIPKSASPIPSPKQSSSMTSLALATEAPVLKGSSGLNDNVMSTFSVKDESNHVKNINAVHPSDNISMANKQSVSEKVSNLKGKIANSSSSAAAVISYEEKSANEIEEKEIQNQLHSNRDMLKKDRSRNSLKSFNNRYQYHFFFFLNFIAYSVLPPIFLFLDHLNERTNLLYEWIQETYHGWSYQAKRRDEEIFG